MHIILRGKRTTNKWWCNELASLKNKLVKFFNRAKNSRSADDWQVYKDHQRLYKKEIRKRQRDSWRDFCSNVESSTETSRIKKILMKDRSLQPSCIKRKDGEYTSNLLETAGVLMETHFPGCQLASETQVTQVKLPLSSNGDWELARDIVDEARVTWAVNSFSPYKSPGLDGIVPVLLQWGLQALLPSLLNIFQASIALQYLPESWRMVRVVFIPKPGRSDYTQAKSYRPISLTSFLLKVLERLCDRYIKDTALLKHPLHQNQHAYLPGKSTESALHSVVNKVEYSLTNKMSTLGIFIDIEGAFDKVSTESIVMALNAHGVAPTLCRWIEQMLSRRVVSVEVGETKVRGTISRGCPQGGVLSPLLWNLVVDNLLCTLNSQNFYTIGYADDITILISGKFEGVVCNLMQTALKLVEKWCNEHALSVNPHKTELVLFTKKRKIGKIKQPILFHTPIPFSDKVKYLGIILDKTLNWSKHLEYKTNKACITYWQCRRAVGRTWGLSPRAVLWLYTAVIRPMLCYGAIVWWPRTRLEVTTKLLGHVQRMVCLGVTGALRTTPTAAIETVLQLPPLQLHVEEVAVGTAIRLRSNGLWKGNYGFKNHTAILREATEKMPLLGRAVDWSPPKYNFKKEKFRVCTTDTETLSKPDLEIYTDGSKTKKGSGAGVFSPELDANLSIPLGENVTVFQAEIYGIYRGAVLILENEITGKDIRIITDSKAALKSLRKTVITSRLVQSCCDILTAVSEKNTLSLTWTRSHVGNRGNERADKLARQAADMPMSAPQQVLALARPVVKELTKELTLEKHKKIWKNLRSCRLARTLVPTPTAKLAKQLLQLSRDRMRLYIGVVTGHYTFNQHMHRLGVSDTSDCRGCHDEDETAEHVLCYCPALSRTRWSVFGVHESDLNEMSGVSPRDIVRFISNVGWLEG